MNRRQNWLGLLAAIAVAALVVSCGSEQGALPSGSTGIDAGGSTSLGTVGAASQKGNGNGNENAGGMENENENEAENENQNENENVNPNENGAAGGAGAAGAASNRFRGILFDGSTCTADECTLVMKQGTALVTAEADLQRDLPGDVEIDLTFAEFAALVRPGLPARVRGSFDGGVLVASRARIDDELDVSGTVTTRSGDAFTIVGPDGIVFDFVLAPGAEIDPFGVGDTVRVEAIVPETLPVSGLPTFTATEVQVDN